MATARLDGWNLHRLASGNTRQKGEALLLLARRPGAGGVESSPMRLPLVTGLCLAAAPLAAQLQPIADSAAAARRAGQWETLARLAQKGIAASTTTDDRCRFGLDGLLAQTRLWRYASAPSQLSTFDARCRSSAIATADAATLEEIRQELKLPPMPVGPVDWTAVDEFWRMVDTLSRGIDPQRSQWRSLMATPGYRIAMISHPEIQRFIDVAFRPTRRAERDSILRSHTDDSATVAHLVYVGAARAELVRFRAQLEPRMTDTIAIAVKNAARFLPPGATDGVAPPLVTITFFASDGYSQQPGIVLDLQQVRENGLTGFLSHEFHHSFSSRVDRARAPTGAYAPLYGPLRSLRNEGIADMIDKPHPLTGPSGMQWYVTAYNSLYDATPAKLKTLDSLLAAAAADSTIANAAADKARALLPYNAHPNGAYMARTILETFGADSVIAGVYSPYRFIRTYVAAETKRGHPSPFSPASLALLDALERR